jgi:hypothetical protein
MALKIVRKEASLKLAACELESEKMTHYVLKSRRTKRDGQIK